MVDEAFRVLVSGGRVAMTIWRNAAKSPGAWMLAPFLWATERHIAHQAEMVSLGRPGVGEAFLADRGFESEERFEVPFVFEFPDPETYARGMAATGPAYQDPDDRRGGVPPTIGRAGAGLRPRGAPAARPHPGVRLHRP
jgi:hypothetical protein